jgi:mono/diheme cytochrome c family protein
MPSYATLKPDATGQIIDYLASLKEKISTVSGIPSMTAPVAAMSVGPHGNPGAAAAVIGSADHGAILFERNCVSCHGLRGTGKVANPGSKDGTIPSLNPIDPDEFNSDPKTFAAKVDLFIQHGSRPEGPSPIFSMLPFGDTNALTQQQIADLEAYILSLNGVDRSAIDNPGIPPYIFFIITAFTFSLVGLNLCGWWWFGDLGADKRKEE